MLSVDWLNVTISSDRQEIIEYLQAVIRERLNIELQAAGGAHGYQYSKRALGCVIAWGGDSQRGTLLLSLSGLVASSLQWYGLAALVRALIRRFSVNVRFTRVDLAVDVPGAVWRSVENYRKSIDRLQDGRIQRITIYQGYRRTQEGGSINDAKGFVSDGFTLYVGSRTSERMLRIYDKRKETGRCTRFEFECKERYAAKVGYLMLTGGSIRDAWRLVSDRFFSLDGLVPEVYTIHESYCLSVPKKKLRDTSSWLYRVASAVASVHDNLPGTFQNILVEGREKQGLPPYGNTGVHLQEPNYITEISHADLNLHTFGTFRHPHDTGKNWAVLLS